MNTLGLATIFRMGCVCVKESITINNRRFYIRSRLGEGGFSVIDLLEDSRTRRLYALKRITCHGKEDERIAMREVEIMKTFHHPCLVPLEEYAMITVGHHVQSCDEITETLIVMPFYRRGSIQERIDSLAKRGEQMKEEDIWAIFLGLCKAVKVLHDHNPPYAHRDIKPGNIMLDDHGEAVLMDLGSSTKARVDIKTRSEATSLQLLLSWRELGIKYRHLKAEEDEAAERCSMLFRPPELFTVETGTTVDERTDVWSLGCTLYAMAYLESPFEKVYQRGDSIALAVMGNSVRFPQNSGYTSAIEETIKECMVVNIMERPFMDQILNKAHTLAKRHTKNVV